jgi:hypothetical protein
LSGDVDGLIDRGTIFVLVGRSHGTCVGELLACVRALFVLCRCRLSSLDDQTDQHRDVAPQVQLVVYERRFIWGGTEKKVVPRGIGRKGLYGQRVFEKLDVALASRW